MPGLELADLLAIDMHLARQTFDHVPIGRLGFGVAVMLKESQERQTVRKLTGQNKQTDEGGNITEDVNKPVEPMNGSTQVKIDQQD